MNHPFKLGRNRVALERRVLAAVVAATAGLGATRVFNFGTDEEEGVEREREESGDEESAARRSDAEGAAGGDREI